MQGLVRGHNEGSIFRRKTGEWIAAVTLRNGKRATRWSKSREEAKADLAELLRLRDAGAAQTGRVRLGDYLLSWVSREHDWAPATRRKHEAAIRVHLSPALGGHRLSELSPSDVERALREAPVGPQSRSHLRATLRRALADAERDGLVQRNVAGLARSGAIRVRERPVLDADQARLLIDSTRGTRYGPLWAILVTTGMRISEALGLAWSDVVLADKDNKLGGNDGQSNVQPGPARDAARSGHRPDVLLRGLPDGGRAGGLAQPLPNSATPRGPSITVRHALQRVAGEWQLRPPKTAKGRRTIPLTPLGREALRAQREQQRQDRFGGNDASAPAQGRLGVGALVGTYERGAGEGTRTDERGHPRGGRVVRGRDGVSGTSDEGVRRDSRLDPAPRPNVLPLDDSLVFTTSTGHPIHATNLLPKLRADLAAAGLPTNIGLHSLRHSSASILLRAGLPLPTISAILGHSTIRITADIYAHVMEESKVEAAEAMQRMLG